MADPTAATAALKLDGALMLAQLEQLGMVGLEAASGGRTRLALTDADRDGRDLLRSWMQELGLFVGIDRIGNLIGTLPTEAGEVAAPLMIGSHIDSVRNSGALDGCYGVLAGLAVTRAFRRAHRHPPRPIAVAAFTNEEGVRFQPDMMGSLVLAGGLELEAALDTVGIDGTRLGDELARIGYAGEGDPAAMRPHEYLELHIEQGPILDAEHIQIGVVETLQGISWQRIVINGNANHAGTTPLRLRHDAGYAAAAIVAFIREAIAAPSAGTTLATTGCLRLEPDVINVIPRRATLTVDLRDPDNGRLERAEQKLAAFLATLAGREGVWIEAEQLVRLDPVVFDPTLTGVIEASARTLGLTHRRMTSGAGHDAQMIARIAPAAMIFVPSREGISHNPREHTDPADLVNGAEVLLEVVLRRLGVAR